MYFVAAHSRLCFYMFINTQKVYTKTHTDGGIFILNEFFCVPHSPGLRWFCPPFTGCAVCVCVCAGCPLGNVYTAFCANRRIYPKAERMVRPFLLRISSVHVIEVKQMFNHTLGRASGASPKSIWDMVSAFRWNSAHYNSYNLHFVEFSILLFPSPTKLASYLTGPQNVNRQFLAAGFLTASDADSAKAPVAAPAADHSGWQL